jgi:Secretion system C-terminal sorting domain
MKNIFILLISLFSYANVNSQNPTFELKVEHIINGLLGKTVIVWGNYDWVNNIISVEWKGPNGFHRYGTGVNLHLSVLGEYCVTVISKDYCVANGCITVKKCWGTEGKVLYCNEGPPIYPGGGGPGIVSAKITTTMPSPFHDQLTVSVNSTKEQNVLVFIGDVTNPAKIEKTESIITGDNQITIQTGSLPIGTYTLRIVGDDGQESSKLVIKI